jgi:DNA mismatch repair ATPase MutS
MNILDMQTRDLIFMGSSGRHLFPVRNSDISQKPLSNIGEINRRLDSIEELVKNEELRTTLYDVVMHAADYHNILHRSLIEYVKFSGSEKVTIQDSVAKGLADALYRYAESILELPLHLEGYTSQILRTFTEDYNTLLEDGLADFFKYVIMLGNAIEAAESNLTVEDITAMKTANPGSRPEKKRNITTEELSEIVDCQKIMEYKDSLDKLAKLADNTRWLLDEAEIAFKHSYVRPVILPKEKSRLIIKGGKYHPTADPNDTILGPDTRVEIIGGPNNSGKTYDIKKVFLIAIRALSGCFVPAEYCEVSIFDRIIMREKGTGDAISAFQQDCQNVKDVYPPHEGYWPIGSNSIPKGEYWLIAMDESFTSSEARGGEALAAGFAMAIVEQGRSLMIMSSHYPNLSSGLRDIPKIRFSHFTYEIMEQEYRFKINYPHKKVNGPLTDLLYALNVAKSERFCPDIITYAHERLERNGLED